MRILLPLILLAVLVSAFVLHPAAAEDAPQAGPKKAQAKTTLADLAFLVGSWTETEGPSVFAETWLPAQGDAMAGVAHWTIQGRTRMYEMMSIEQGAEGLVLHVRHFHRGLVPWPSEARAC